METENVKKLGHVLLVVLTIIIGILIAYLITAVFKVDNPNAVKTTTTKVRVIEDEGTELTLEQKIAFNTKFNDQAFLLAFVNALNNSFSTTDVNLISSEDSKFKFIYTYQQAFSDEKLELSMDELNRYSKQYFNTELSPVNLKKYEQQNLYQYDILYSEISFCLKANKEKENTLLIDMISKDSVNCDINVIDYQASEIVNKLTITYDIINSDYIYKSFIVVNR